MFNIYFKRNSLIIVVSFTSVLEDWLTWCSLIPSTQMLRWCVKLGHNHFLSHPFQYITRQSSYRLILYNLSHLILQQIQSYEFVTYVSTVESWLGTFCGAFVLTSSVWFWWIKMRQHGSWDRFPRCPVIVQIALSSVKLRLPWREVDCFCTLWMRPFFNDLMYLYFQCLFY